MCLLLLDKKLRRGFINESCHVTEPCLYFHPSTLPKITTNAMPEKDFETDMHKKVLWTTNYLCISYECCQPEWNCCVLIYRCWCWRLVLNDQLLTLMICYLSFGSFGTNLELLKLSVGSTDICMGNRIRVQIEATAAMHFNWYKLEMHYICIVLIRDPWPAPFLYLKHYCKFEPHNMNNFKP